MDKQIPIEILKELKKRKLSVFDAVSELIEKHDLSIKQSRRAVLDSGLWKEEETELYENDQRNLEEFADFISNQPKSGSAQTDFTHDGVRVIAESKKELPVKGSPKPKGFFKIIVWKLKDFFDGF